MRALILGAVLALLLAASAGAGVASAASTPAKDTCANRLCTADKPGVKSCRKAGSYRTVARCYILRAARHYRQPTSLALYIAHRESRYQWWITNAYGYRGLYQFGDRLWRATVYHRRSPYDPRYAALAAMRLWSKGGYHHWTCC